MVAFVFCCFLWLGVDSPVCPCYFFSFVFLCFSWLVGCQGDLRFLAQGILKKKNVGKKTDFFAGARGGRLKGAGVAE